MNRWVKTASLYGEPRVLGILFLGFSSGLPFLLTLATLHVWLTEVGVNKTTIGLFVFVTLPYTLKFLWAPLIDRLRVPLFCDLFGRRKGWILASQLCLIFALLCLGNSDPVHFIWGTAFCAFFVALCSATQDIVVEAYRVEALEQHHAGPGAGASVLGYRLGMWVSGAGALYLASHFSWFTVYAIMGGFVIVGIVTTLLSHEPEDKNLTPLNLDRVSPLSNVLKFPDRSFRSRWEDLKKAFERGLLQPLNSLFHRRDWVVILFFIFFYKVGDTVLNTMTMPFLLEIGFTKIQIAHVAKSFGIGAMILGGLVGGIFLARKPLIQTLLLCSFLQILASIMFMTQAMVGNSVVMLFATIGIENLACGMGTAAFIAYLSSMCRLPHTATHFALLSSFGSLARVLLSSIAGWCADHMAWSTFYGMTAVACVPCLILLITSSHHFVYHKTSETRPSKVA